VFNTGRSASLKPRRWLDLNAVNLYLNSTAGTATHVSSAPGNLGVDGSPPPSPAGRRINNTTRELRAQRER